MLAIQFNNAWAVTSNGVHIANGLSEENAKLFAASGDLSEALHDLIRCIRDFQLGDYSPLMDEIFDGEYALRKAKTGSGELPD